MGRKTGAYKFEKRRKELKRQKKREEKLARKLGKVTDETDEMVNAVGLNEAVGTDETEEPTTEPQ
jgi:hypothetical protein